MSGSPTTRLAPIVAGLGGLAWFWFELAPQRAGFEDTDNPAVGLQFLAADPGAWQAAGLSIIVAAIALVATVLAVGDRLERPADDADPTRRGVASRTVTTLGLFAAFMLLGQGVVRLSGGPVTYVQGLDQGWGEAAYLVTQFVGMQLFAVGGTLLLAIWTVSVAWLGVRRGTFPAVLALLAIAPGVRILGLPWISSILPETAWLLFLVAIPAAFLWLVLLGAWPAAPLAAGRRVARSATV